MESTEYSPSSFATPEHEAQPDSGREWVQQNGVHMTESGLPSMAYDRPSVLGHEDVVQTPAPVAAPVATHQDNPTDRARGFAQQLASSLTSLGHSLDETEVERQNFIQERAGLQDQIRELQQHQATKERFVETLRSGAAGSVGHDDLDAIRGMMDALSQDPDRLTVLFTVVQQAGKLAAVVNDYAALRRMVESD